ncbi:MAG: hypothetical protein KDI98_01735 [Hyphomicrobiaceae bacterium]|nr:hypothetical protein [Hyphomicrobiaceae bacterium]
MFHLDDIVDDIGLTPEEIGAISEHEHIDEEAALALAAELLQRRGGASAIRQMIVDDMRDALARGEAGHARQLLLALRHFLAAHPEGMPL